jgi:ABC-type glycerol-3-phosphate transport system substrate-binding protein
MPDAEPGEIVVMAKWGASGGEGEAFLQVLDAFEAETGIGVNYVGVGDQVPTVLSTQVAGGQPPDVAILPQTGLMNDLVALNALIPIEDAAGDEMDAHFSPAWRELGSINGTLYGVMFKVANKSTVWYDVQAFADNGITPPATWDEWITANDNLLDAGITPVAVGGADGWTLSDWFENIYLRTAGPELYDQLSRHEIPWTDESVRNAFEVMGQIIGQDDFVARGLSGALQVGFGDSVKLVFGDSPEAAIVYEADFVEGVILNETSAQPGTGFDFFPFPTIAGSDSGYVLTGGDVAVVLKDNPEAMALVEYLATPESAEIWAALGGYSSANKDVDTSIYATDLGRRAVEAMVNATAVRYDMGDIMPSAFGATGGAGFWGGLQDWLGDPADLDSVLEQMEAEAAAAFG